MGTFLGYFVKNNTNNTVLDNSILAEDGYKSNPNIQQDEDSYRDGDGVMNRKILPHEPSKFWVQTLELSEEMKAHVQTVFSSRKKTDVTYWNDETNNYEQAYIYIPDIDWTTRRMDKKTFARTYAPITITAVEY